MPVIYRKAEVVDGMRPRISHDVYQTPYPLALAAVSWLSPRTNCWGRVLDPGAGSGVWGKAVRDLIGKRPDIDGIELRQVSSALGYTRWRDGDFLGLESRLCYDVVLGNPPFKLAEKFIRHSQELLVGTGTLMFLLPSEFSHGQKRGRGLFREYRPEWQVELLQRPQFTGPNGESLGDRNTDTYILMVWGKESAKETRLDWLDWR